MRFAALLLLIGMFTVLAGCENQANLRDTLGAGAPGSTSPGSTPDFGVTTTTGTPAVADAVIGTANKTTSPSKLEPAPQSGLLTAGSFDDNLDPAVFRDFVAKRGQSQGLGDLPRKMNGQRLQIIVRDCVGRPVNGASVSLTQTQGMRPTMRTATAITTHSDGRAVFVLSYDDLPTGQPLTANVTPPGGGLAVTEAIPAGSLTWDVRLPSVAKLPKFLDLAIVLDTTGSMGDELNHVKAEVRGIAKAIQDRFPEVQQRFGLVLYRDEGDEYVARHFDFATLDQFHKNLSAQSAGGGGDYPEAMHRGLEAANQLRWRERDSAKVVFLIADAPPHAQYMNQTLAAANELRKKGVAIYPIACSGYDDDCEFVLRSCALLTGSQFLFLTDDSGVGNAHAEPKIPYYNVERLERLMIRMIASELSGQRIEASQQDIIRSVGKRVN